MNSCFKELSSMTFLAKFRIIFSYVNISLWWWNAQIWNMSTLILPFFFHLLCSLWDFLLWAFAQLFYFVTITKISYYNQYLSLINCSPQAFTKGKETNEFTSQPYWMCSLLYDFSRLYFFSKFFLLHSYHISLFSFIPLWPFDLFCQWNVIMTNILPDQTFSRC